MRTTIVTPTKRVPGRAVLVAVSAATLLVAYGAPASAATAYGKYGYYGPVNGKSYRNRSYVSNWNSTTLVARSLAEVTSGGSVATGWIGVLPRLYKGTALCAQTSDYRYNSSDNTVGFDAPIYGRCGGGAYNSYGVTRAWNGSSYNSYYTFRSPNING